MLSFEGTDEMVLTHQWQIALPGRGVVHFLR